MSFLIEATLKGTLLLLVVTAGAVALRRSSAANRHLVWGVGLAGLLVLPLASLTLPWRLPVLPGTVGAPTAPPAASVTPPVAPAPEAAGAGSAIEPWGVHPAAPAPAALAAPPPRPFPWATAIVAIWAAGALAVLAWLGLGHVVVARMLRRAEPLTEPGWQAELAAAARRLGVGRAVELRSSRLVHLPVTVGVFRPRVILPIGSAGWTDARRHAVLLHELAHVRRRDLLAQLVARLACAAYWFHPLAWLAARRLRLESERACDDLVLLVGTRPSDYAGLLLQLVRIAGFVRGPAAALPMAQPTDFEGRLLAILQPGVRRRPASRRAATLAAVVAGSFLLPIAALGGPAARVSDAAPFPPTRRAPPADTVWHEMAPRDTPRAVVVEPHVAGASRFATASGVAKATLATSGSARASTTDVEAVVAGRTQARAASPVAVRGLIMALDDRAAEVRRSAAEGLGNLQDTAAVSALVEALRRDSDAEVRKAAAWALGQLESRRAVPALVAALREDREVRVRRMAAWALGQIADPASVEGLSTAVHDPDLKLRSQAVWALGQIQAAGSVPALVAALQDSAPQVRKQAAWALGQVQSAAAVDPLVRSLGDRDRGVREQAAWALGQIESPRAVSGLTGALRDSAADVRQQAAWALGQIQSPDAVDGLAAALADGSAKVREQVAWALGQIQSPRAAAALAGALNDSEGAVRRQAIWAIGQLEVHQAPPALIDALKDPDPGVRRSAAEALSSIGDTAAVPALIQLVRDPDARVRHSAIEALARFDDPRVLDALVEALRDSSAAIRRAAAQALGRQ